jgi:protein-tyrosine phosphatase
VTAPYWINSQIAIVPKPEGGERLEDEMQALHEAGVDIVVSMLESAEAGWLDLAGEESAAERAGISFVQFPVPDGGVPADLEMFTAFLDEIERQIVAGKRIGVHCHGCVGRAPTVVVSLLIRSGVPVQEAWEQVLAARGCPVGTDEQREWVSRHIKAKPS